MSDDAQPPVPLTQVSIDLPPEVQVGVFADFANVWHTPSTFVLDFVAVTQPMQPQFDELGMPMATVLPGRVAARVRIPSEQIFPVIEALQAQANQWLAETGREEPPESYFPGA